jgi:2-iminobutanoate/2-iminopropanoate deaminase
MPNRNNSSPMFSRLGLQLCWLAAVMFLCLTCSVAAAEIKPILPPGVKSTNLYSPGLNAGAFLYVAGQGGQTPDGKLPNGQEEQIRQCLKNVRVVIEAGGLTMDHVVYVQAYLTDYSSDETLNRVWKEFFPKAPPARSVIGVAGLHGTSVEMTAVAVKDLATKKAIVPAGYPSVAFSAAVRAGELLFVSGFSGRDLRSGKIPKDSAAQVELAFGQFEEALKAAGAGFANLVFVNPYMTSNLSGDVMNKIYAKHFEFGNTPARATIEVAGLTDRSDIEFTGVAIMDLSKRRAIRPKNMPPSPTASPCVFAGDILYCSAKSGFIPGVNGGVYASTVGIQVRQTMRNLLDGLEEAGLDLSNIVASNVYLNKIEDMLLLNDVYSQYFKTLPPTRTTIQQVGFVEPAADAKGRWPTLEQISIIAVK